MFEGRADRAQAVRFEMDAANAVVLPAMEDLIADRLAQYEANRTDESRLNQARYLFRMAEALDMAYLRRRVAEEGGDILLLPGETPDAS